MILITDSANAKYPIALVAVAPMVFEQLAGLNSSIGCCCFIITIIIIIA